VNTPPSVSMPSDSGVTSSSSTSLTSPASTPRLDGGAHGHHLVRVHALVRAPCRRTPSPAPAPSACGSCRPPGRPRRSRWRLSPASLSACRHGSHACARSGRRPAPRAWRG
jgi:hypothetical protein